MVDQIEASLMSAMKGRYWAGKGAVLKATVALTKLCPGDMLPKIPKLIERFMRECGREKESIVYCRESVTQLGCLLAAAPSLDAYTTVEALLMDLIRKNGESFFLFFCFFCLFGPIYRPMD